MSSGDGSVFWNYTDNGFPRSFVGLVQIFSDKTATMLKSSAYFAYKIYIFLLNTSPQKREWLINDGFTIFVFLPVSFYDFDVSEDVHDFFSSG